MMVLVLQQQMIALNQVKLVPTVNLIGRLTDLNAVILHGMSMALIALHLKVHITGIVPVVHVRVMVLQNVVMATVQVMRPMTHAQMIVCLQVNVRMDRYLIVMEQMNAGQNHG
jgi:hypothetical protein